MALTLQRTESLQISYAATRGLLTGALALAAPTTFALADGTAAGQGDSPFTALGAFQASDTDAYLLSAGLQDGYGRQLEFTAVKFLRIVADLANTSDLVVGGGSWPGKFGDAGDTLRVRPGAQMTWETMDANGWPVVAGADELLITSSDAAAYSIIIVGVSTQLSAPAISALKPALVGIPRVGTPVACTEGDWSGQPAFSYQWRRGGSAIPNATGAIYTPVAADLGKALSRTTFAANIAGEANASATGVLVQAAQAGVCDLDLNSGTTRLSALGI